MRGAGQAELTRTRVTSAARRRATLRVDKSACPSPAPCVRAAAARAAEMGDAEEARLFQPEVVDETRCRALMWNRGFAKLQCCRKPLRGSDLCGTHVRAPHGKVRGPIPK